MDPRERAGLPKDTPDPAWRAQMDALAAMTPGQRLALWEQLNDDLAEMEERAVRRQHPGFSDDEVHIELVRRRHGAELAEVVRRHLAAAAT